MSFPFNGMLLHFCDVKLSASYKFNKPSSICSLYFQDAPIRAKTLMENLQERCNKNNYIEVLGFVSTSLFHLFKFCLATATDVEVF